MWNDCSFINSEPHHYIPSQSNEKCEDGEEKFTVHIFSKKSQKIWDKKLFCFLLRNHIHIPLLDDDEDCTDEPVESHTEREEV
jgi:hypothetical protein